MLWTAWKSMHHAAMLARNGERLLEAANAGSHIVQR